MEWIFGVAMVIGIAPALVLMFLGVRNYTYPKVEQPFFSDPTFFSMFVVGLVAGAILSFVMWGMGLLGNVVAMVIFALIEAMVMVVVMNLKRFRGKSDSVFYGYSVGLGLSSGMASGLCFYFLNLVESYDVQSIVFMVVLSVSMAFVFGASGTTVGEGIARHRVMEFALQAVILVIIFNMLTYGCIQLMDGYLYLAILAVMIVLGFVYYYRIMMINLPQIVREVLKMEGKKRDDIPRK